MNDRPTQQQPADERNIQRIARGEALNAALQVAQPGSTPAQVIGIARQFELYLDGDDRRVP